jgi:AhpD family alkylhydroperoxidase
MEARLNVFASPTAGKVLKHLVSAGKLLADSTLPTATQELVKLRASQINGCGFCTDMHTKDAAAAGETSVRLNLVAAWREATVFTEAERAALELTEQGTRIADAAGGSRTRPGRMLPSTTTRSSSSPWCPRSPSSTPSTG